MIENNQPMNNNPSIGNKPKQQKKARKQLHFIAVAALAATPLAAIGMIAILLLSHIHYNGAPYSLHDKFWGDGVWPYLFAILYAVVVYGCIVGIPAIIWIQKIKKEKKQKQIDIMEGIKEEDSQKNEQQTSPSQPSKK